MTEDVVDLLKKTLALPVEARAAAGVQLLDVRRSLSLPGSLHILIHGVIKSIEKRRGTAKTVPWTEVRRRITAKLSRSASARRQILAVHGRRQAGYWKGQTRDR